MSLEIVPAPRLGDLDIDEYTRLIEAGLLWNCTSGHALGVRRYLSSVGRAQGTIRIADLIEDLANGLAGYHAVTDGATHDPLVMESTRLGYRRMVGKTVAGSHYERLAHALSWELDRAATDLVRPH